MASRTQRRTRTKRRKQMRRSRRRGGAPTREVPSSLSKEQIMDQLELIMIQGTPHTNYLYEYNFLLSQIEKYNRDEMKQVLTELQKEHPTEYNTLKESSKRFGAISNNLIGTTR